MNTSEIVTIIIYGLLNISGAALIVALVELIRIHLSDSYLEDVEEHEIDNVVDK